MATQASDPLARPVFVVGPPSSGQVAMRESLLRAPGAWRAALADLPGGAGADPDVVRRALREQHADDDVRPERDDVPHRLVCTDPVLVSWVPFLDAVFPDARFVYLHRDPAAAVPDAVAEWRDGEWPLGDTAPAGSEDDVVAQWAAVASGALDALETLDPARWRVVDTADLVRSPDDEVQRVFAFLDLGWHSASSALWRALARAGTPPEAPEPDADDPSPLAAVRRRVRAHAERDRSEPAPDGSAGEASATDQGLGALLKKVRSSLLVSTYQSNRLMVLRHDQRQGSGALGVHLRTFDRPMGIAITPGGFALGGRAEVWDFRDLPAAAPAIEPAGAHDAAFLPRNAHVTGDIAVHELEVGRDGLWVVATRFSCLATLDLDHSFVPRWMPSFVSAIAPEDRCHLNGMALVDGVPRYVTALGTTDTPGGWRDRKVDGGVIIDVATDQVVVSGLSMPHSPRWHDGRLWVLESGRGRLSVCDPVAGTTEVVAELPGFTRGLRFLGTTAFVGTSQIRETATFGGLPIASLPQRECGVWAVDTRTGELLGSVRFDSRIQEIFDVAVLEGRRFPEVSEPTGDLVRESWFVPPIPGRGR